MIEGISAITLSTRDMRRAVGFYSELGFVMLYGGEDSPSKPHATDIVGQVDNPVLETARRLW